MKTLNPIANQLNDARIFQIMYLLIFLIYGTLNLKWDFNPLIIISIILSCILTQIIACYIYSKSFDAVKSALVTSLGLSILLKTDSIEVAILAGFIAISSKYILRINTKHIFNPANIGIIAAVYLTNNAWVSPGQWGSNIILLYFIGAAGTMMLFKVGRIDTGIVFLLTYGIIQLIYSCLFLQWPFDFFLHKMSNGALLLYSFFMITDPSTTPNNKKARIIWSVSIAVLSFYFAEIKYMNGAPIKALFIISLSTPVIDYLYKGQYFSWKHSLKF